MIDGNALYVLVIFYSIYIICKYNYKSIHEYICKFLMWGYSSQEVLKTDIYFYCSINKIETRVAHYKSP